MDFYRQRNRFNIGVTEMQQIAYLLPFVILTSLIPEQAEQPGYCGIDFMAGIKAGRSDDAVCGR